MNKRKIFALDTDEKANESTLYIYDDVCSGSGIPEAVRECKSSKINVRINSYGGEVGEGLAIYNALKESRAEVVTYCDSMACSIASVIFMAGSRRVMSEYGYLLIHNAWSCAQGNANEMRKVADNLEKFTQAAVKAYVSATGISEEQIQKMLDDETVIDSDEAVEQGFATEKNSDTDEKSTASQSAKKSILQKIRQQVSNAPVQENEAIIGDFKVSLTDEGLSISIVDNNGDEEGEGDGQGDDGAINEKAAQKVTDFLNIIL